MADNDHLDCGAECFRCKLRSIQWSPSCTPTRRNSIPPPSGTNHWERGIATDNRGMPLLDKNLEPIGLKVLANNRRQIESDLRRLQNTPPAPSTP